MCCGWRQKGGLHVKGGGVGGILISDLHGAIVTAGRRTILSVSLLQHTGGYRAELYKCGTFMLRSLMAGDKIRARKL